MTLRDTLTVRKLRDRADKAEAERDQAREDLDYVSNDRAQERGWRLEAQDRKLDLIAERVSLNRRLTKADVIIGELRARAEKAEAERDEYAEDVATWQNQLSVLRSERDSLRGLLGRALICLNHATWKDGFDSVTVANVIGEIEALSDIGRDDTPPEPGGAEAMREKILSVLEAWDDPRALSTQAIQDVVRALPITPPEPDAASVDISAFERGEARRREIMENVGPHNPDGDTPPEPAYVCDVCCDTGFKIVGGRVCGSCGAYHDNNLPPEPNAVQVAREAFTVAAYNTLKHGRGSDGADAVIAFERLVAAEAAQEGGE